MEDGTEKATATADPRSVFPGSGRQCPKCDEPISLKAIRCPHCLADLGRGATRWQKVTLGAKLVRDWIGFPAAVAALLTAFFTPTVAAMLSWFDQDRAYVTAELFNPDIVNVGLDDRGVSDQTDRVTQYISLIRVGGKNTGYSTASIRSNFRCALQTSDGAGMDYYFDFYDIQSQRKFFPTLDAGQSIITFGKLTGSQEHDSATGMNTCEFSYVDRYGPRPPYIVSLSDRARSEIAGLAIGDEQAELQSQFCAGMVTQMRLSDKTIADCVNDTHAIAIEPIYLWKSAVARAMQFSTAFGTMTGQQSKRAAGAILVCNDSPDNCKQTDANMLSEMDTALSRFQPPITTWFCSSKPGLSLADCTRRDFPLP
ncbi:hypothetical protein NKH84_31185 [Mesorhizobium sp. M0902]|uniref:hypothetical protein n=1 Tax=unclassified Mesorhizobium TaxID=325217 RepID=UPI000404D413|nr:hypothetical protein [Mesorhizobium sp. LSJC280B00]